MSRVKKFTDFFAFFGAFSAALYLVIKFMPFKIAENEDAPLLERLKAFFAPELKNDYVVFLVLLFLFLGSFLLSRILPKLPALHFGISLLPLGWSFFMFDYFHTLFKDTALTNRLKERPMVFLICALLNTAGALADCFLYDRKHGTKHATVASWIPSALLFTFALDIFIRTRSIPDNLAEMTEDPFRIHFAHLNTDAIPRDFEPYLWIALIYAALLSVSILLRKLPYVSAILSLCAGIYTICAWHTNDLPLFGASLFIFAVISIACYAVLTFVPQQSQINTNP